MLIQLKYDKRANSKVPCAPSVLQHQETINAFLSVYLGVRKVMEKYRKEVSNESTVIFA